MERDEGETQVPPTANSRRARTKTNPGSFHSETRVYLNRSQTGQGPGNQMWPVGWLLFKYGFISKRNTRQDRNPKGPELSRLVSTTLGTGNSTCSLLLSGFVIRQHRTGVVYVKQSQFQTMIIYFENNILKTVGMAHPIHETTRRKVLGIGRWSNLPVKVVHTYSDRTRRGATEVVVLK